MLIFNQVIIDENLLNNQFCCHLSECKGQCCVEGELGAPVLSSEIDEIERNVQKLLSYLPEQNRVEIERKGFFESYKGDLYLETIEGRECVFATTDSNGVVGCAIEKAYYEGQSDFLKPISCHLFPIRVKKKGSLEYLEYMQIPECRPARENGRQKQLPVYRFLKDPLSRKYGQEWVNGFLAYCDSQIQNVF
jgi:hypothetical protein